MRQSKLFTKTRREAPKDEVSKNAKLLIRGGYVHKESAGVYSFLPLGLRVLKKIENIVREEMNAIGGQELFLTSLQTKDSWEKSGRWSDDVVDVWFKTALKNGTEIGLAPTHEEPLTNIMREHIRSHKDLPIYTYQFQTKFRNETRAKSGIMRSREFIMKDLYSFDRDEKEFRVFYELCAAAYLKIFERVGIGDRTYRTFASGGSFSKFSDEFQTVSDAGEDTIYVDKKRGIAINEEIYSDEILADLGLERSALEKTKSIEVGNIFPLGTRFSEPLGLVYKDENGERRPVYMGSYGIGPGRLMGTVVESTSDERGIVWPESIAPFAIHLILAQTDMSDARELADEIYELFSGKGIEVLLDDRNVSAGEKFADSELIGIPHRVTIGTATLESNVFEYVERKTGEVVNLPLEKLIKKFLPQNDVKE
jgi:prolyl-tRNA synthetase